MSELNILQLLTEASQRGASDLHFTVGQPPACRVEGILQPLPYPPMTSKLCRELTFSVLTETQRAKLESELDLDFSMDVAGIGRLRGNAHFARGTVEAAFRFINRKNPSMEELGLPPVVKKLCSTDEGLILITGATGSGKSTTMAAMIEEISRTRSGVIVVLEDPIEYVFPPALSLIKQREIGRDTQSFPAGLRHALRQDPDVIAVTELRDQESVQVALQAAETGHLVLATFHASDPVKALDRILEMFGSEMLPQIRAQLGNGLKAVISQRLLPKADGQGRVLAAEVLTANPAVSACLRTGRMEQIVGIMEIGGRDGMRTIDSSLDELVEKGLITSEEAVQNARDPSRVALAKQKKKGLFG
jgi:twitching motility protein PilT